MEFLSEERIISNKNKCIVLFQQNKTQQHRTFVVQLQTLPQISVILQLEKTKSKTTPPFKKHMLKKTKQQLTTELINNRLQEKIKLLPAAADPISVRECSICSDQVQH